MYAVKLPKKITEKTQDLEYMKSDITSQIICKLIVDEMNKRLISLVQSEQLLEFIQAFIYEIDEECPKYKFYYGETFIEGEYKKYNNNGGWFDDAEESHLS